MAVMIWNDVIKRILISRCVTPVFSQYVRQNSNRTSIAKIGRDKYLLMYPTVVVNSDGSTFTIRHHEPRKIIELPLDLSKLTEEELNQYFLKKKPKDKIVVEDDIEDDFDVNRYSHLWNKKTT